MKPKLIISEKDGEIRWTAPKEDTIEFVINRIVPSGSNYVFMYDDSVIEKSFTFCYDFNFNDENGSIAIPTFNVEKGKELFMENAKRRRTKIFPDLDVQYMKALESGNQTLIQEIVTKKQALRDITTIDFSDVVTPSDVKSKWPIDILGEIPF